MEASTNTVLRCVALLSMLVLSLAAAPSPQESVVIPDTIRTLICGKKCAISCGLDIVNPLKYVACFGLCMTSCKIGPNSDDVGYGCTRSCVSSMSKVMTTVIAKLSISGTYSST